MIPALSIRQPWAWLIVNGYKDIENRDWRTPFRGRFLVHASKTITRRQYVEACAQVNDLLPFTKDHSWAAFEDLQLGGIVGHATLVDCVQDHPSPWKHAGSWGFVLANRAPLPFTPYRGRLGFFNVAEGVVQA